MKQIKSAKRTFLLEAPLEVLHAESMEWLEEIEFWKDESSFFYALIIGRNKANPAAFNSKEAKNIESHLVYVSAEKLDDLALEVKVHEKFLTRMMKSKKMNEQLYRSRHRVIARKIHSFESEFREMKNKIFKLVGKVYKTKK